jgi:hypothetical protein
MEQALNIMRHASVFNPVDHPYTCHIIGAGATGSRIFAGLVELGVTNISVYDPDVIEDHNLANQIYMADDVGQSKVEGCSNHIKRKLGVERVPPGIKFYARRVTGTYIREGHLQGGVVFILTDTMASRKEIFDALVERCVESTASPSNRGGGQLIETPMLIIETRMGSTHGSVYTINPFNTAACKQWQTTLVDDTDEDNIELSPCGTTLSVGTTASLIANYAVWQMMQFFVDPVGLQPKIDLFFKPTMTITSSDIA